jgi:hypothetical protein
VPVIKERIKANTIAHYLAAKLRPFYAEGKGEIVWPFCLSYIIGERFWPFRFARSKFVANFEDMHQAFEGTACLGLATGYGTRMYEAQIIYSYCMGNSHKSFTEDRLAPPFPGMETSEKGDRFPHRADVDEIYGVFFVSLLKDLFEKTSTALDHC